MRTKRSIINLLVAWIGQVIIIYITFKTRIVFTQKLGEVYLGINSLFTGLVSMLAVAELGIGTAIDFRLYEPIEKKDYTKISIVMSFYQKIYSFVGLVIFALGVIIALFIDYFIKDIDYTREISLLNLRIFFILFVINISVGYFYSYRTALLIAAQKRYIYDFIYCLFFSITGICQQIALIYGNSYFLYLVLQIMGTIIQNIVITFIVKKKYPEVVKTKTKLSKKELKEIKNDTFALAANNVGTIIVNSTDNVLISKFVGIVTTGIYTNYYSILNAIGMFLNQISGSVVAGIGSLNVSSSKEDVKNAFDVVFFVCFSAYGICVCILYCCISSLVILMFGEQYRMSEFTVFLCCIRLYLTGMRSPIKYFKNALGIYWYERKKPIYEVLTNLIVSILLVRKYGINGIIVGTIVSIVLVCTWYEPYILYKYGFEDKNALGGYYLKYIKVTLFTLFNMILWKNVTAFFAEKSVVNMLLSVGFSGIGSCVMYSICFWKDKSYKYIRMLIVNFIKFNLRKKG